MAELGALLPNLKTAVPGPSSVELIDALAQAESPAFTARRARRAEASGAKQDPIVWAEARGANVVDADGNVYVDLVSGFGAASIGHRHPDVERAVVAQTGRLVHAMGDLYPADVKIALLGALAARAPFPDARVVLALSGADAVETAIKTSALATGRPGMLAFERGYHGLEHGPLAACGYSEAMRRPFAAQLNAHVTFAPFPELEEMIAPALEAVERALRTGTIGAVLVEPIQGRGGVRVPAPGFLRALGETARRGGALLVVDEVFTGFGRCGARFASVDDGAAPDLVTVGKALGGGLPVSACLGRDDVMQAWGTPDQEAIHTGTFYGHPLGCAAALATLDVIEREDLATRARELGDRWRARLAARELGGVLAVRGRGMLVGVVLDRPGRALGVVRALLRRGWIALPAGPDADVVELAPPLNVPEALLEASDDVLAEAIAETAA
jgi:4-aminobutyrate aminotransferase/(S)-3-amino-2-methylpropionate transaminase